MRALKRDIRLPYSPRSENTGGIVQVVTTSRLTLSEAARRLGLSATQTRRLVDEGVLAGQDNAYGYREVEPASVDAYLQAKRAPDTQEGVS